MPTYSDDILRLAEITPIAIHSGAATAELANRLCGDRVTIAADWNGNLVRQIEWQAEGCAILKASVAYLARTLKEKSRPESEQLLAQFLESFENENSFRAGPLAPVYKLPARYKCALLPWQAYANLLRGMPSAS